MPIQAANKKKWSVETKVRTGNITIGVHDILKPNNTKHKNTIINKLNHFDLSSPQINLKAIIMDFNDIDDNGFCNTYTDDNFEVNPVLYCVNTMRIEMLLNQATTPELKKKFIEYEAKSDRKVVEHLLFLCDQLGVMSLVPGKKKKLQTLINTTLGKLKEIYDDKNKWDTYIQSTQFKVIKDKICKKYFNRCDLSKALVNDIETMYSNKKPR